MNQLMTILFILSVAWLGYLLIDYASSNSDVMKEVAFNSFSVFVDNPVLMACISIILVIQGIRIAIKMVVKFS